MKKIIFLLIFAGCKTQEEIQREKLVDNMAVQMAQNQKISAQYSSRALELEEKLTRMIGSIDEREYKNFQSTSQEISLTKKQLEELKRDLEGLKLQIVSQREYLEKILASLSKMGDSTSKKKPQKANYEEAIRLYNKGNAKEAKPLLKDLLEDKKLKPNQKAKVTYFLAMLAYQEKRYSEAVTLFSRLYTENPDSSHNPSALLYLGRSFLKMNKEDEGKQVLVELIEKYPKNNNARKARETLKNL